MDFILFRINSFTQIIGLWERVGISKKFDEWEYSLLKVRDAGGFASKGGKCIKKDMKTEFLMKQ
jgi:hypothetical protein